jgi:fatty acid amide hydrolase
MMSESSRESSAVETVERLLRRIDAVNPKLNAVVERRDEAALAEARAIDERRERGEAVGPLAGVPVSIKECFRLAGTDCTIGLSSLRGKKSAEDGLPVRRLRAAGAIPLCKTNVPQLMIWHESDNPVYGRTNNPWDLSRGPGGSSGGEGALIGAGASLMGLGSDLGGSIRLPAHFCGVHGFKPTNKLLPRTGSAGTLHGMNAIEWTPGPLARRVADLATMLEVLTTPGDDESLAEENIWESRPVPWRYERRDVRGVVVGVWDDDGYFAPCAAVRRAVDEAADALAGEGARIVRWTPPDVPESIRLYFGLLGADGGADAQRMLRGSDVDERVATLKNIAKVPVAMRPAVAAMLRWQGQIYKSDLLLAARPVSADGYWRLNDELTRYRLRFLESWEKAGLHAAICPPHALPAMPHRLGFDLIPAASYAFLMNLVGFPAGTVSLTRVREDEQSPRAKSRDAIVQAACTTEENSAGLPIGVQVAAPCWQDSLCLSVMQALEGLFAGRPDYPLNVTPPGIEGI